MTFPSPSGCVQPKAITQKAREARQRLAVHLLCMTIFRTPLIPCRSLPFLAAPKVVAVWRKRGIRVADIIGLQWIAVNMGAACDSLVCQPDGGRPIISRADTLRLVHLVRRLNPGFPVSPSGLFSKICFCFCSSHGPQVVCGARGTL
jgi:hypothetical protein